MSESINISIQADIKALRDELAKMPDIGAREAKKLVKSLETEYKRAERAAARAAKRSADAWADQLDGIKSVGEQTGSLLGGVFGDLADVTFGLTEQVGKLAGTMGSSLAGSLVLVGGVAAASAGALGFVVGGLREIADGAIEARDRLTETSQLWGIPPESLESLRNYEVASADLAFQLDRLQVIAGGQLADDLAVLAASLARLVNAAGDVSDRTEGVANTFRKVSRVLSLGTIDLVYGLTDAQYEAVDAAIDHERAVQDETAMLRELGIVIDDNEARLDTYNRKTREAEEAARKAAEAKREAERIEREYQAALKEGADEINERYRLEQDMIARTVAANEGLAAVLASATADQLTEEDLIRQAHEARLARIDALAGTASDTGAIIEAKLQSELRMQRDLLALEQQRAAQTEVVGEVVEEVGEEQLSLWDRLRLAQEAFMEAPVEEKLAAIGQSAAMAYGTVASLLEQLHQNTIDAAEAEAERMEENFARWREGQLARLDGQIESGELSEREAILERRRIDDEARRRRSALNERLEAERDAARRAFDAQQQLAIAQATIDSIAAGIALIPAFAYLGPGAPLAAAAVAGTALAGAVAGINAQQPPSFERGGLVSDRLRSGATPDHLLIAARPDEGVLTGRGVQAAGGRAGVEALNRGRAVGGGPVNLYVDGRMVASAVVDHLGDALLQPTPGSFAAGRRQLYGY